MAEAVAGVGPESDLIGCAKRTVSAGDWRNPIKVRVIVLTHHVGGYQVVIDLIIRNLVLFITAVALLVLAGGRVQAAWQVTDFVVYEGIPVEKLNWRQEEEGKDSPVIDQPAINDIESYLHAVAKHYESMGFPDPVAKGNIDSIVKNKEGREAIRIYVYKSSRDSFAWYDTPYPCNLLKDRRVMHINTKTFGKKGNITGTDYATLAHELFHAIQSSSKFYKQGTCKRNKWVNEGTADAVGHYMARTLRNAKFEEDMKSVAFLKVYGGRNYSLPLNQVPDRTEETYGTSSFWRHLAEVAYANAHGKTHQGSRPSMEDYRYLAEFLNTNYTDGPGIGGEITWLNRTMKENSSIRNSLSDIYPRFVSSFADHMNTRIPELGFEPTSGRQGSWLKRIFGSPCEAAEIPDKDISAQLTISLKPNAARCFTVKKSGTNSAGLTIEVIDRDAVLLKQLTIGMLDGTIVLKPVVRQHAGNKQLNIASWVFPVFGPYAKTFVISNMAKNPASTMKYSPELQLSLGTWNSSMTKALSRPPPQEPPDSQPQGPQQIAARPTHREQHRKQLAKAIADPVINLKPVTKLERKRYDRAPSCDPVKLLYNKCGPQLVITLQLSPIGLPGGITSFDQGGYGDLVTSLSIGGYPALTSAMLKLEKAMEGMDAGKIRISLPKMDYGFTGMINNADIWVSKGNGGDDNYRSYGPSINLGGRRISRPPNGKVNIDEYSPLVLRGTFNASLVDESNPGRGESPIIATSISGSFMVTSAWMADESFVLDEAFFKQEMLEQALRIAPFDTSVMKGIIESSGTPPQALCEFADEHQIRAMGFKQGCENKGGGVAVQCSCECDIRKQEEVISVCKQQCGNKWKQCPLPEEMITDELAEQIAYYKSLLTKQNMPQELQGLMIDAFSKMPPWQRKLTLQGFK